MMKSQIVSLIVSITAGLVFAAPVPLNIQATGNTDRLVPTSMTYQAPVAETTNVITEVVWIGGAQVEQPVATNIVPAVDEAIIIHADYKLKSGIPVVDVSLDGINTRIAPKSNPTFAIAITVPITRFTEIIGAEQTAGITSVLQIAGKIIPNATLTQTIRMVAAQVLSPTP